jgi:hypothetical protein
MREEDNISSEAPDRRVVLHKVVVDEPGIQSVAANNEKLETLHSEAH